MDTYITPKGVFHILEGFPRPLIRPIRVAAIIIPQFHKTIIKEDLKRGISKDLKNAEYSTSPRINQDFLRLREENLIVDSDRDRLWRFRRKQTIKDLVWLMDHKISLLIQRIDREHVLLVGLEFQPEFFISIEDIHSLTFRSSILDIYPNLVDLPDVMSLSLEGEITLIEILTHPQASKIDYRWISSLIDQYLIEKLNLTKLPNILQPSQKPIFYIKEEIDMGYSFITGTPVFIAASRMKFNNYLIDDMNQIMFGHKKDHCPPGYTPINMSDIRLDLNSIMEFSDESRLLMQIYEYLFEEDGFSTAFAVTYKAFMNSVHEYSTRYNTFSKLLAGLEEALKDGWMINAMDALQTTMSGLSGLSHNKCFDKGAELQFPKNSYIILDSDLPTAVFFVITLMLKVDIDGLEVHRYIFDCEHLSMMLFRERIQTILKNDTLPFFSYDTIHRITSSRKPIENFPILVLDEIGFKMLNRNLSNRSKDYNFSKNKDWSETKKRFLSPYLRISGINYTIIPKRIDYRVLEAQLTKIQETYIYEEEELEEPVTETTENTDLPQQINHIADIEIKDVPPLNAVDVEIEKDKPIMDFEEENILTSETNSVQIEEKISSTSNIDKSVEENNDQPPEIVENSDITKSVESEGIIEINTENEIQTSIPKKEDIITTEISSLTTNSTYEEIFDTQNQMEKIRKSTQIIDSEEMLEGLRRMIKMEEQLLILRNESLEYTDTLANQDLLVKGLVEKIVTTDGVTLVITEFGSNKLKARMTDLAELSKSMGERKKLEKLLDEHPKILETARSRGKLAYLIGLINWSKLLSVCYFNRYSKYDPITSGFARAFTYYIENNKFLELKQLENTLLLIVDGYLEHFHEIEQEIRKPYVTQEEPLPVPKPNEEKEEIIEEKKTNLKKEMKAIYLKIKDTTSKVRKNEKTLITKRKASLRKKRNLSNIYIPRNTNNEFKVENINDFSVQHLKLPNKFKTYLKIVAPQMTIGEFRDSDTDWTKLDFTNYTLNPVLDIRGLLRSDLLPDDLLYLLDDKAVQTLLDGGMKCAYYPNEMRLQVPKGYFANYIKGETPKTILENVLNHLLDGYEHEGGSIDDKLQILKDKQRTDGYLIPNEILDLSYGLKFQELFKEDKTKLGEFIEKLSEDLDNVLLPVYKLKTKNNRKSKEKEVVMA